MGDSLKLEIAELPDDLEKKFRGKQAGNRGEGFVEIATLDETDDDLNNNKEVEKRVTIIF